MPSKDREQVHVERVEQWRGWLEQHADRGEGVWLVTWKKATGLPSPSYDDVVCEALAVGWVDSTAGTLDDERSMLWFAPRKRGSGWSRANKQRLERLEREGRMRPRGQVVVDAAKADGSWALLDDVEDLVVPPDLAAAFAASRGSREVWEAFPRSVKRMHLERLVQAKREQTRQRRIEDIVSAASRGERAWS
ncbi:MAG: YdeI/OmpD-associated family protein [Actinomycetes bacterium]